jgi:hypothetical protein
MPRTAKSFADEIQEFWDRADSEGPDLTPAERIHMSELVSEAKSQHDIEKQIREIGGSRFSSVMTDPNASFAGGGPGDHFIASKGYQRIADPAGRGQTWSTGPVEVSKAQFTVLTKGTMLETTAGGPGGGMVPPMYQPGVVDKLFEPLGVSDVFGQSTTTATQVRYVNEGTATSGAAGVAEAGTKPESTIAMQAEAALDMNALRRDDPADMN